MNRKALLAFLTLIIPISSSHAQWFWQNPLPQGNSLYSATFVNQQVGYVGSNASTILKTTDGGTSWFHLALPKRIFAQAMFFLDENHGWIGGQQQGSVFPALLMGTTNGGTSWKVQLTDSLGDFYSIYFVNSQQGWAAGQFGRVHHTNNGGTTWQLVSDVSTTVNSLVFLDTLNGWAVSEGALRLHTSDGGVTWQMDTLEYGLHDIVFVDSLHRWECGNSGVDYTTDGGTTWHQQLNYFASWNDIDMLNARVGWTVGTNSQAHGVLARTTNGGSTWLVVSPSQSALRAVAFRDSLNGIAVGPQANFIRTSDGGVTWQNVTQTVSSATLNGCHFLDRETGWIAGGNGTVVRTSNAGSVWTAINTGVTSSLANVYFANRNAGWAVGTGGTIIRTTDGGNSWTQQLSPSIRTWRDIEFGNYPIGWIVGGDALSDGRLLRTLDGGNTWNEVGGLVLPSGTSRIQFTSQTVGWIMCGSPVAGSAQAVYKSTDGGLSWHPVLSNNSDTSFYDMSFVNDNVGWVSTFSYMMFATTDGGGIWKRLQTQTPFSSIHFLNIQSGWAGSSSGEIYMTTDGGNTWQSQNSPLGTRVAGIAFADVDFGWAVGFNGAIIHTSNGGTTFVGENTRRQKSAAEITLDQNYPNPFNSETTISFNLQIPQRVLSIQVFDILGRTVKALGVLSPNVGPNHVRWNGTDEQGKSVSSGVYFYNVSSDGYHVGRKMLFVR